MRNRSLRLAAAGAYLLGVTLLVVGFGLSFVLKHHIAGSMSLGGLLLIIAARVASRRYQLPAP
jgi:hypothetical protein